MYKSAKLHKKIAFVVYKVALREFVMVYQDMNNTSEKLEDAILSFTLGEVDKAHMLLQELVKVNPNCIDSWRALAEVCLARNELNSAEDACRKALEIDGDDLTIVVSLARILVQKGDKDGAEKASSKARLLGWKEELAEEND
jgi:cytochrome c-type biogenesis protein CcmH/NrfG